MPSQQFERSRAHSRCGRLIAGGRAVIGLLHRTSVFVRQSVQVEHESAQGRHDRENDTEVEAGWLPTILCAITPVRG
jgi:hypothetical protein